MWFCKLKNDQETWFFFVCKLKKKYLICFVSLQKPKNMDFIFLQLSYKSRETMNFIFLQAWKSSENEFNFWQAYAKKDNLLTIINTKGNLR